MGRTPKTPDRKPPASAGTGGTGGSPREKGASSGRAVSMHPTADAPGTCMPAREQVLLDTVESGAMTYLAGRTAKVRVLLKKHFPQYWIYIYAAALLRTAYRCPLGDLQSRFECSILKYVYPELDLGKQSLNPLVDTLGTDRMQIQRFMRDLAPEPRQYVILEERRIRHPQQAAEDCSPLALPSLHVLHAFSQPQNSSVGFPSWYRKLGRKWIDLQQWEALLREEDLGGELVLMGDKEAGQGDIFRQIVRTGAKYVIPLHRGSEELKGLPLDTSTLYPSAFQSCGREVRYCEMKKAGYRLFVFSDRLLRACESDAAMAEQGKSWDLNQAISVWDKALYQGLPAAADSDELRISLADWEDYLDGGERELGTLAIRTNLTDITGPELYHLWLLRQGMAQFLNAQDRALCRDLRYIRNSCQEEGWLFLNYLSAAMVFDTVEHLSAAGETGEASAEGWYEMLRSIQVSRIGGKWVFPPLDAGLQEKCRKMQFNSTDLSLLELE